MGAPVNPELGIAWVPASSSTLIRLRAIAPPRSTVVPFPDEVALLEALTHGGLALTVVEAGGATHALALRVLRRVHEAFPQHPLIAWCDFNTIQTNQLIDVARSGAQDIVRHEFDELRRAFARIIATATQRAVSVQIAMALRDVIPKPIFPVFEYALEHADEHLDRAGVAAVFGVSRRTLHDRLIARGFPSTRTFLNWCRLLVASALLDQPGHTLDSVAGQLDYSDGGVLGNTLRRYTGLGLNRLRPGSVLDATLDAFRAILANANYPNLHPRSLPVPSTAD